jgi:hypothetical protein
LVNVRLAPKRKLSGNSVEMLLDPILPEASAYLTCACRHRMALTTHVMTTTVHADMSEKDSVNVRDTD